MLELAADDYQLTANPSLGGSIARFDWRGEPLMRPASGRSILDAACFPLVPFSNRVAQGRFDARGVEVRLRPNFPGSNHPHPIHGFGWLSGWTVTADNGSSATLEHLHSADEWPWPYVARQHFVLDERGLTTSLAVQNLGLSDMPAGLGLHPYFPRNEHTRYHGLHRGEWRNGDDCLPVELGEVPEPRDWWNGAPVEARVVDTVFMHRAGPLLVEWPDRRLAMSITPSAELCHTVVYVPCDGDFFCVEPVSHITDAVNSERDDSGIRWLAPGECLQVEVTFTAAAMR